jgi:prepilin-type N-terminal cleavage/methylation domain-containing protein
MKRGFTIVELLTVLSIVALLSGIVFAMSAGPREKAREASCASNLHQIYVGLSLYSADWPGPEQMPGLGDIRLLPSIRPLLQYIPSRDVFFCPNTTAAMRQTHVWSTYELNFLIVQADGNQQKTTFLNWWTTQLETLGQQAPLVICNIHDETYYAPRETNVDPDLAQPFQIHLQLDGATVAGRFPGRRFQSFPNG